MSRKQNCDDEKKFFSKLKVKELCAKFFSAKKATIDTLNANIADINSAVINTADINTLDVKSFSINGVDLTCRLNAPPVMQVDNTIYVWSGPTGPTGPGPVPTNVDPNVYNLSLIHISEPTRRTPISYAVF